MDVVREKAKKLGIANSHTIERSNREGKRFKILVGTRYIHFGSDVGKTFIDHHDEKIRAAWRARHREIKLKNGKPAYQDKNSPEYYSWHLLW